MRISCIMTAHLPVLRNEVTEALRLVPGHTYVDATFGLGGYSRFWLEKGVNVVAFDRDPAALPHATMLQNLFADTFQFHALPFSQMKTVLAGRPVHGIAFDVGVSSPQLDLPERGFSFRFDGPLDMRMEQRGLSAADIVNTYDVRSLSTLFYVYGEERHAGRIARAIVAQRTSTPFTRTLELANLVRSLVPRAKDGIDPATRTFQGLRIAVNQELEELEQGLQAATSLAVPEARLAVVSFHSLEDRVVKTFFTAAAQQISPSRHVPIASDSPKPLLKIITRKPLVAGDEEITLNSRARSAKLRVAEKL
jgi:16S rRNA (cytosine1402-N4)-methyltransferase